MDSDPAAASDTTRAASAPPSGGHGEQPSHGERARRAGQGPRETSSREYRSRISRLLWGIVYRTIVFFKAPIEIIAVLSGDYLVVRAFRYLMGEELTHSPKLAYAVEACQLTIAFLVLLTVVVHLLHSVWVLGTFHFKHGRGDRD